MHRLFSNTKVKDGSLLAFKSVCGKFQENINEQQDATEFCMKYRFDVFLSENSLSTGFPVKVCDKSRKCFRVVTSESFTSTVLTIPICYDISGENLRFQFLHEVTQFAKPKQCRCSCMDFFECNHQILFLKCYAQPKESTNMANALFLTAACLFQHAKGHLSVNWNQALAARCVCFHYVRANSRQQI